MNDRRASRQLLKLMAVLASVLVIGGMSLSNANGAPSGGFVERRGSQLVLDGKPFRVVGPNMYWLGLDENILDASGGYTYPTQFRVDDAFAKAKLMNATVVRAHTLGVSVGCPQCIEPSLGQFNEKAFESIDYAVAQAGKSGIKLMIPLVDQWNYYHGGKRTFTGWRGYKNSDVKITDSKEQEKSEHNFYTDPLVIADFKQYISHILNHTNSLTGLKLKDDPTIAIWETGNEIWDAPPAWTQDIASFIKNTEKSRQLVADGTAGTGMHVGKSAIDAPDVDVMGGHFYPRDTAWMIEDAKTAAAHNKAYIVGEYDWTGDASKFLAAIETDSNISGDLYWSLFPVREDGSQVQHNDGFTIHVPGDNSDMVKAVAMLTDHAAKMVGSAGSLAVPGASPTVVTKSASETTAPSSAPLNPKPMIVSASSAASTPASPTAVTARAATSAEATSKAASVSAPELPTTGPMRAVPAAQTATTSTTSAIKSLTTTPHSRAASVNAASQEPTTVPMTSAAGAQENPTQKEESPAAVGPTVLAMTGSNANALASMAFLMLGLGGLLATASRRLRRYP